ncbi:isopenicillin N synthase family dioxygenase [Streptomyces sp. NPDC005529]|uniref:isopenicillin N synthase family dioxygenase n=1 Tax=unclassified Streptomyces TaxID=2593676 RepID=UPI0033B409A9
MTDRKTAAPNLSAMGIPTVDFEDFDAGIPRRRAQVVAEMDRACREYGIFYIRNHGVSEETVERAFAVAEAFFACPVGEKKRVASLRSSGWHDDIGSKAEISREGYRLDLSDVELVLGNAAVVNRWPARPTGFQENMVEYGDAVKNLSRQILRAIALAFDLSETHFFPFFSRGAGLLHPLYYPPQSGSGEARVGLEAHTDFGALTVLAQGRQGGLQVLDGEGRWTDVPPVRGTFVVNTGQLMRRWTNDLYASVTHRVVNTSGVARYSIPCFCDPDPEAVVECLPSCVAPGRSAKYPPVTVSEHIENCVKQIREME